MQTQPLTLRLQIILYPLSAVAIALLIIDQYRQGLYALVLSNAIGIPVFLFSAGFLYINRNHEPHLWIHHVLITILSLLALYQLLNYPALMTHYLYAIPLFGFFCLPIISATIINLIVITLASLIIWTALDWQEWLRISTNLYLFLGSVWSYVYITQIKQSSLSRLSLTDQTSGAYNRRHFYHTLEREISRCERFQHSLSLVALTVDEYQQMIDIHGRQDIDSFLGLFTKRVRKGIRAGDEVFRFNDDIFILLLPNCPRDGAIVLMERIKRHLQQHSWDPIAELSLSTSTASWSEGDNAQKMPKMLLQNLTKRQKTTLQFAAFSEQ